MNVTSRRGFLNKTAIGSVGLAALVPLAFSQKTTVTTVAPRPASLVGERVRSSGRDWSEWSEERARDGSQFLFQSTDFVLSPSTITPSGNLCVFADRLTIRGACVLPGRDVFLFARELIVEEGAIIKLDGVAPPNGVLPNHGINAGDPGAAGATGVSGSAGGNLRVLVGSISGTFAASTTGGAGGVGQAGGNGQIGTAGYQVTPGGRGGNAGEGGQGGVGGPAGALELFHVGELSSTNIPKLSSNGGLGGDAGADGQPGPGGAAGPSYSCQCRRVPVGSCVLSEPVQPRVLLLENFSIDAPLRCPEVTQCETCGSSGSAGPGTGISPRDAESGAKRKGTQGPSKAAVERRISVIDAAKYARHTQLRMTMHACDASFLNEEPDQLIGRLMWCSEISGERITKPGLPAIELGGALPPVVSPGSAEWTGLHSRAAISLRRLSLGLDYFGRSPGYVTLLSDSFLEVQLKDRLAYADSIEQSFDRFVQAERTNEQLRADVLGAMSSKGSVLNTFVIEQKSIETEAPILAAMVASLNGNLEEYRLRILAADSAFKAAVAKRNDTCSFVDLINFAVNVYLVANGAWTAASGLFATFQAAQALNWKDKLDLKGIVTNLKSVNSTFKSQGVKESIAQMQTAYAEIKDQLHSDNTKIAVSLENFEKVLDDYAGMPEAENYRQVMRQLSALAQQKNTTLLQYSALVIRAKQIELEKSATQSEVERLTSELAVTDNPMQQQFVMFMADSLARAKQLIIETLDLRRRSISYVAMEMYKLRYQDETIAALKVAAIEMSNRVQTALQRRNGANQKRAVAVQFSKKGDPIAFQRLAKSRVTSFNISPEYDGFRDLRMAGIIATGVSVELEGAKFISGTKELLLRITHEGRAVFLDPAGSPIVFQHRPRSASLSYTRTTTSWVATTQLEGNLRSDADNMPLSLCGGWSLEVLNTSGVDLSGLLSITMKFACEFVPQEYAPNEKERTTKPILNLRFI